MIIAIWGSGGVGKTTIACGLGSMYAGHGTVGIIDTNLCGPTLPIHLSGVKLDPDYSLGRYLNRLGTNEVRPYYHQHPICDGMFLAGLSAWDTYTDYEIGFEAIGRAMEFLERSEETLGTVIVDGSAQRTDPFLPVMLRRADAIILPIVPNIGAVHWYVAIRSMLENAGVLSRTIPIAVMTMPFHLIDEVERQTGVKFVAQFRYSREMARLRDECRLATDAIRRDGLHWSRNLRLLYAEIERRQAKAGEAGVEVAQI